MTKELFEKCPQCDGNGWYADHGRDGEPVQVQCENCAAVGYIPATPSGDVQERAKEVELVTIVTDAVICGQNNIGIDGDYIGYGVKNTVSSVLEKHGLLKELDIPTCDNCKSDFHSCDCGQWSPVYPQPYLSGASSMQAENERLRELLKPLANLDLTGVTGDVVYQRDNTRIMVSDVTKANEALNKQ